MQGFKISTSPRFWTVIDLEMVGEDGRALKGKIRVQYKRMNLPEFEAFFERSKNEAVTPKLLLEVVTGWQGAQDDSGDMEFTPENFERFCNAVPGAAVRMGRRFFEISNGTEARTGN